MVVVAAALLLITARARFGVSTAKQRKIRCSIAQHLCLWRSACSAHPNVVRLLLGSPVQQGGSQPASTASHRRQFTAQGPVSRSHSRPATHPTTCGRPTQASLPNSERSWPCPASAKLALSRRPAGGRHLQGAWPWVRSFGGNGETHN